MGNEIIDLRSDTITLPTAEMRGAMAKAQVGDDQFGEDPSINLLQDEVAKLLGKEAALWLPTGTMANQTALRVFTRPGDDVIVSRESHTVLHETGGAGANAGIQLTEIGSDGHFSLDEFLSAIKPRGHIVYPPTTLVEIENTHNRAGGIVFPQKTAEKICAAAKEKDIATYLDGARLWNAAVASNRAVAELAATFDLVSVAFSKGLGAPGGSMLAGSKELIEKAKRYRRMFGGAMRQVGIFAEAGRFAIQNHMDRLAEDHANCRIIAEKISQSSRVILDLDSVQTNILVFSLNEKAPDANTVVSQAHERGVLVFAFGPRTIRAVTHLDVSKEQCERAAAILLEIIES
jgi:threonine aldolase